MRHTSSGSRCSSTLWFGWKGGSNQNQRSVGKAAFIFTSAMRNRSWKMRPLLSRPMSLRTAEREPSQATTQSASMLQLPWGVSTCRRAPAACGSMPVTSWRQRRSIRSSDSARSTRWASQ